MPTEAIPYATSVTTAARPTASRLSFILLFKFLLALAVFSVALANFSSAFFNSSSSFNLRSANGKYSLKNFNSSYSCFVSYFAF